MLCSISSITSPSSIALDSGTPSDETGLETTDALEITVFSKGKKKAEGKTIWIGNQAEREGTVFAKRGNDLFIVDGNLHQLLDDPLESLREQQLVTAPIKNLVQIAVKTSESGYVVQKNPRSQTWSIAQPYQAAADQGKIDDVVAALLSLQVFDVEKKATKALKVPDPLPEDSLLVQLGVAGANKPITLFMEKDREQSDNFGPPMFTARITDRQPVFKVRSMILKNIPRTPAMLRDRRLATIAVDSLQTIGIVSQTDPPVQLFPNQSARGVSWKVDIEGRRVPANHSKVNVLLERMNSPVILNFIEDNKLSEYGLAPAAMRIGFDFRVPGPPNEDGSPGEAKTFRRILQLGFKQGDTPRLFANFLKEPDIFEVDPSFASLIPTHPVKWRSVNVLNFNPYHLLSIHQVIPGRENLLLEYIEKLDSWKATREGVDLSANVDPPTVTALRDRLASLQARGWVLRVGPAYKALEKPGATFTIVTRELDPATNNYEKVTRVLRFAPSTTSKVIYGRIDDSLDIFYITEDAYGTLLRPVTDSLIRPNP